MDNQERKILVVEDERSLLEIVKKFLTKRGFKVLTATSSKEAQHLLKEVPGIGLIWLDHYLMGKETGLDLIVKIKEHSKWKNIPVFIVSVSASEEKTNQYIHLGVDKFYTKSNHKLEEIVNDVSTFFH